MPTYDYKCVSCKETQEVFLPMKDAIQQINMKCEFCEGTVLEKQFSGTTAIAFKGPGFYCTDNPKKG
jgi:putative FmdB family regulatory protein